MLHAGVRVDAQVSEQTRVYAEALRADDAISGAQRQGAQVGVTYQASERLTVDLAVCSVHEDTSANGNGLSVAAPWTVPPGATGTGSLLSGNGGGFFCNGRAGAIDPATGLPIINNGAGFLDYCCLRRRAAEPGRHHRAPGPALQGHGPSGPAR